MRYGIFLTVIPDFKPGDPPPTGYVAWHEWASVQRKAGLRQRTCGICGLWRFPQEMSTETITGYPRDSIGRVHTVTSPVCLKCVEGGAASPGGK